MLADGFYPASADQGAETLAAGDTPDEIIYKLLDKTDMDRAQIVTLYYGKDANESEANEISDDIRKRYPGLEVGTVRSGQPNYHYIISVE